jgi:hypothetical protein
MYNTPKFAVYSLMITLLLHCGCETQNKTPKTSNFTVHVGFDQSFNTCDYNGNTYQSIDGFRYFYKSGSAFPTVTRNVLDENGKVIKRTAVQLNKTFNIKTDNRITKVKGKFDLIYLIPVAGGKVSEFGYAHSFPNGELIVDPLEVLEKRDNRFSVEDLGGLFSNKLKIDDNGKRTLITFLDDQPNNRAQLPCRISAQGELCIYPNLSPASRGATE